MTSPTGDRPQPSAAPGDDAAETQRAREDDKRRMLQNAMAFVFIVALLCLSAWLIDRLAAYNRALSCLQAHHRNCG